MRTCLILGGADSVWPDIEAALDLGEFYGIVGANLIGIYWPGSFDAFVSLHPDKFKIWAERRRRRGLPAHKALIGNTDTDPRFPGQEGPGSSGLFALKVALIDLGFDRAVLCGVPLTTTPHFNDAADWRHATYYHAAFHSILPQIAHRTRSMSGLTRDVLGSPTSEWISGEEA